MKNSRHMALAPESLMAALDPRAQGGIDALLEFHRATFGDARMDATASPEKPEGVSDEEWGALGDPGKAAIVRERERAATAERELAALRAAQSPKPAPPAAGQQAAEPEKGKGGGSADLEAVIQRAIDAAVKPFQERQEQWEAEQAAGRVQAAVREAAAPRFHDPTDVLAQVDLAGLTDGNGGPDAAKISQALDGLASAKPHLVKPWDERRRAAPGSLIGATAPAAVPLDDRVKQTLARMQQAAGIRPAS